MVVAGFNGPNVPLVGGSVVGVRSFDYDSMGRLHGITYMDVWRPGENKAVCGSDAAEPHRAGASNCTCGYWAYFDYDGDSTYLNGYYRPDAIVKDWGRVTMGERGFRAEKAEIVALIAPQDQRHYDRPLDNSHKHWDKFSDFVDNRKHKAIYYVLLIALIMASAAPDSTIIAALGIAASIFLAVVWTCAHMHGSDRKNCYLACTPYEPEPGDDHSKWLRVLRNYPGVPVFDSMDEAVKAFPLSGPPAPDPDSDDFWDIPVAGDGYDMVSKRKAQIPYPVKHKAKEIKPGDPPDMSHLFTERGPL